MEITKIFGWVLILGDVLIIIWTLYSSYNIFTAKISAPEIFEMEERDISSEEKNNQSSVKGIEDIQNQMGEMVEDQIKNLIPTGGISKLLNLAVWTMLATILIFGGVQISKLGIKLVKNNN